MLLVEGNNVGAQDLAIDLAIDGVTFHCGKNPPLCHLDCIGWFIAYFDVQLFSVILFDFKKLQQFWKLLEKIFPMALVPFF